jgi:hypothetical protein
MFTWALESNKMPKHCLIRWRNVGSLTFFVCLSFAMVHKSRYLKSVNHKIVMWNTNRPMQGDCILQYFLICFFHISPFFLLNCVCHHLFSAENFSVFMYILSISMYRINIKSYLLFIPHNFLLKIWKLSKELPNFKTKTIQLLLPYRVVNIGQDVQWNVNKPRICKLSTTDCFFLEIFDFDY